MVYLGSDLLVKPTMGFELFFMKTLETNDITVE